MKIFTKTSTLFLFSGLFSAFNEAASTGRTAVEKLEAAMPLYTAIYHLEDKWDTDTEKKLDNIITSQYDAIIAVNAHPFFRSPLHRAIEQMNVGAVEWLIKNKAKTKYGLNKDDKLLDPKNRADNPPHLIGHLEEYFVKEKDVSAIKIMNALHAAGLDVGEWPVKDEAFKIARKKFANSQNIDLDTLEDDEILKPADNISDTTSEN